MLNGYVDELTVDYIRGWCVNAKAPGHKVLIRLLAADKIVLELLADRYRPDLVEMGDDGNLGFEAEFEELESLDNLRVLAVSGNESKEFSLERFINRGKKELVANRRVEKSRQKPRNLYIDVNRACAITAGKWQHRNGFCAIRPLPSAHDFNIFPATGSRRLAILTPGANPDNYDHAADLVYHFVGALAERGVESLILACSAEPKSVEQFRAHLQSDLGLSAAAVAKMAVADARNGFTLNIGDHIMAAAAWLFPLASYLARRCGHARPAYFIRNIESLALGLGADHGLLMQAYQEDYLPVVAVSTVASLFCALGQGSFCTPDFKKQMLFFEPAVDRSFFYAEQPPEGKKRLFIDARYYDVETATLPEVVFEAVARMVEDRVIRNNDWDVRCYGGAGLGPINFANNFSATMLPKLPLAEYAREVRSASLAVALDLSPAISHVVLNLAASGVPVITTPYLTKTAQYLKSLSPNIYPALPTCDGVAAQLRLMLQGGLVREYQKGLLPQLNVPASWAESLTTVVERFLASYNN